MDDTDKILKRVKPALEHWNLVAREIKLASLSENIVYKVLGEEDQYYALRVHRPGYHTLDKLNSEQHWTKALQDEGISVPTAYQTNEGNYFIEVDCGDSNRQVGLIGWIDGVLLGDKLDAASNRDKTADKAVYKQMLFERIHELGQLCAMMHNQASGWQPPESFVRHHLNVDGFVGTSPFWDRFWEVPYLTSQQRHIMLEAREKIREVLTSYGEKPDTYSLIHADLHPYNILLSENDLFVIDFDDAGFGWHQYDLAVAIYNFRHLDDFESLSDTLIDGYRQHRKISDEDLTLLPFFLVVRAVAHIGWANARPELWPAPRMKPLIETACQFATEFFSSH